MLSKVSNRVRRRPAAQQKPFEQPQCRVDIAPELVRWSDFSTPFPSVSMGGYIRFYNTHAISESTESVNFCPLLSQYPEPSPSSEMPPKSPLFVTLQRRALPVIREVSLESLTLRKPKNLIISTCTTPPPPRSLKRRRRRLFRTPSIERAFAQGRCQSPSDTITISEISATSSTDIALSPRSTFSSQDSHLSHERSDSNHSDFPITPSTSIDSESDREGLLLTDHLNKLSTCKEPEPAVTTPISSTSPCTKTDFSEI